MIFCLSHHHTGTWSTLAWVRDHQGVDGLITGAHLFDALEKKEGIIHPMESGVIHCNWHPSMVYHEHLKADGREEFKLNRTQVMLATVNPTVIPIRDPLASLISYQHRAERDGRLDHPDFQPVDHMVDRWVRLAETHRTILKDFGHVRFLCWDLVEKMDRFEIVEHLTDLATDLGLRDAFPSVQCAKQMIRNNDLGSYDLKKAYQDDDIGYIRENVSSGGVIALMNNTDILRPFLEGLGYSRLMWW